MSEQLDNIDAAGGANLMTAGGVGMVGESFNVKVDAKVAQLRHLMAQKYEELMVVQGMVATGDFSRAAELPKIEAEVAEHEKAAATAEEKATKAGNKKAERKSKLDEAKAKKEAKKSAKADARAAKKAAKSDTVGLVGAASAAAADAVDVVDLDDEEGEEEVSGLQVQPVQRVL
jgi:membrane protein involved in colicin uptake